MLAIAAGSSAADPVRGTVVRLDGKKMTAARVEAAVKRLMSEAKVPGLAVAILNKGQVVYLNGFGLRDVARNEPMTIDTVMYGASFTKSVFAWMAMQLVEEKTLDLDKPVVEYLPKPLPEYEKYRDLAGDERAKRITARMLLSHTSGFPIGAGSARRRSCASISSRVRGMHTQAKASRCCRWLSRRSQSGQQAS